MARTRIKVTGRCSDANAKPTFSGVKASEQNWALGLSLETSEMTGLSRWEPLHAADPSPLGKDHASPERLRPWVPQSEGGLPGPRLGIRSEPVSSVDPSTASYSQRHRGNLKIIDG